MNTFSYWFECLTAFLALFFMFTYGYFAVFQTNSLIRFYLKCHQKYYLNSLKKSFLLVKYYQAFSKYNYEVAKRQSRTKWNYYNMKICGGLLIFMASFILLAILSSIFKVNF